MSLLNASILIMFALYQAYPLYVCSISNLCLLINHFFPFLLFFFSPLCFIRTAYACSITPVIILGNFNIQIEVLLAPLSSLPSSLPLLQLGTLKLYLSPRHYQWKLPHNLKFQHFHSAHCLSFYLILSIIPLLVIHLFLWDL